MSRLPRGVGVADVVAYGLAVVALVGGGAVFTRGILTFNRGPALAVAVIVGTGWVADRMARRRRAAGDGMAGEAGDGMAGDTTDGSAGEVADRAGGDTAARTNTAAQTDTAARISDAPTGEAP